MDIRDVIELVKQAKPFIQNRDMADHIKVKSFTSWRPRFSFSERKRGFMPCPQILSGFWTRWTGQPI